LRGDFGQGLRLSNQKIDGYFDLICRNKSRRVAYTLKFNQLRIWAALRHGLRSLNGQ
jgi:hypothetical protein